MLLSTNTTSMLSAEAGTRDVLKRDQACLRKLAHVYSNKQLARQALPSEIQSQASSTNPGGFICDVKSSFMFICRYHIHHLSRCWDSAYFLQCSVRRQWASLVLEFRPSHNSCLTTANDKLCGFLHWFRWCYAKDPLGGLEMGKTTPLPRPASPLERPP